MAISERNWDRGFMADFNRTNGRSTMIPVEKRYLSEMKNLFWDQEAVARILKHADPVIYEIYDIGAPARAGDLSFGTTIIHSGVIGDEYHMTRGHYRDGRGSAFTCYTLSGEGYVVMENREKESIVLPLRIGEVSYVPGQFAHRLVNTGKSDLIIYYTSSAEAENSSEAIEENGFHSMIIMRDGYPAIVENPRWSEHRD